MHVSVAIVGFNNADDIVRCLAALECSSHADFEVIICENGGARAAAVLTARLPQALKIGAPVRIVAALNPGFAGGVNVCMRETPQADAWWVLNPDTEPHPEALAAFVGRLEEGGCDAVGGPIHLPAGIVQSYGGYWNPWLARAESIGNGFPAETWPDAALIEAKQNYLNGASMFISRRFLDVAGPMREDYFLYCEEVEWCLRGLAKGLRLGFAPKGLVLHHQGTTTGNRPEVRSRPPMPVYLNERNKILVTMDCFPARLPVAAVAALFILVLRFGKRMAWRQLGYALAGWLDGARGRRGKPDWRRS